MFDYQIFLLWHLLCNIGFSVPNSAEGPPGKPYDQWSLEDADMCDPNNLHEKGLSPNYPSLVDTGRPGEATDYSDCANVGPVPSALRVSRASGGMELDDFYQRYTHAYNIPVIGPAGIKDGALKRLCYVAHVLFADRYYLRNAYYKLYGRFIAWKSDQNGGDLPEHKNMSKKQRRRISNLAGVGATAETPITAVGEEDILYGPDSGFAADKEDIVIHEMAHAIELVIDITGALDKSWIPRLIASYKAAMAAGLWKPRYAAKNFQEYFAEGLQRYFNAANKTEVPTNKKQLKNYDPGLFRLIKEVFVCNNKIVNLCDRSRAKEKAHMMKVQMNCAHEIYRPECLENPDLDWTCPYWARLGYCDKPKNKEWMTKNCPASCSPENCLIKNCAYGGPDEDDLCPVWANKGYCRMDGWRDVTAEICPTSCGVCTNIDWSEYCLQSKRGLEYKGRVSVTRNGETCLPWTHPVNQWNRRARDFPDASLKAAANYCRNPDNSRGGPWCHYGLKSEWDYCTIPQCYMEN